MIGRMLSFNRGTMTARGFALVTSLAFIFAAGAAAQSARPAAPVVRVGPNVQVSAARPEWSHDEVMLAVDPRDPNRMIACSIVLIPEKAKRTTIVYSSRDGGATWKPTLVALRPKESSDPACIFTPEGTAIFSYEAGYKLLPDYFEIYGSKDGGVTWQHDSHLPVASHGFDRQFLVATRRSLYMSVGGFVKSLDASDFGSLFWGFDLLRSRDGGKTWKRAPIRLAPAGKVMWDPGNCAVAADHSVLCVFGEQSTAKGGEQIKVAASRDGGQSIGLPTTLASTRSALSYLSFSLPHIAIDHGTGEFSHRVYVVWTNTLSERTVQIACAHSDNGGTTWSVPAVVSENERGFVDYMPQIAVSHEGVVGVMWYRRNGVGEAGYYPEFAASFDGGETFTAPVRISKADQVVGGGETWPLAASVAGDLPSPEGPAPGFQGNGAIEMHFMRYPKHATGGETSGLVADRNGVFHALWTDDRTGTDQAWTAPIKVAGDVAKFGDPALSAFADITKQIRMTLVSWTNESNKTFSFVVRLKNVGATSVEGPLKLRAMSLGSQVGRVTAVGSGNGFTGSGALWDVPAAGRPGSLAPGSTSGPITLRFALAGARAWTGPASGSGYNLAPFVIGDVRFQVLARKVSRRPEPPVR